MSMRESGMTNQDIADSLDVSYKTVFKLIGKQPKELRGTGRPRPKKAIGVFDYGEKSKEIEYEPCLSVENKTISLIGLTASYEMLIKEKILIVSIQNDTNKEENKDIKFKIDFESIDTFCKEISAINRKVSDLSIGLEMW